MPDRNHTPSRTTISPVQISDKTRVVVDRVKALRSYTLMTGFRTTKSQNDLLQSLDGQDLADALLALNN